MHSLQTLRPTTCSLFSASLKASGGTPHQSYIRAGRSSWLQSIVTTGSTQQNRDHTSACGIPCQSAFHQHAPQYVGTIQKPATSMARRRHPSSAAIHLHLPHTRRQDRTQRTPKHEQQLRTLGLALLPVILIHVLLSCLEAGMFSLPE